MRILTDLTALNDNFSGIERYAACLTEALIRDESNTYILVFKNEIAPMFADAVNRKNVETVVVPGGGRLVFNQVRLPLALRKLRADCWLFMAFPVPLLLMKRNMIGTIHDICCWDCPDSMKFLSKWYFRISQRAALLKCRKILTISEFSRRRIVERLGARREKIELIYCAADEKFMQHESVLEELEKVREKYGLPEKFILSLSTLEPRKNLRLLIETYQQMVREGSVEEELVLAGRKGWKIQDLMDNLDENVKNRIHFTGFVQDEDLPGIYSLAKLFVFPSKYEGFGLPPLEAMACGTPVLSSDAASMPEVLGDAAGYFRSGDARSLAEQMKSMLTEPDQRRAVRRLEGRKRAEQFDWNAEAQKLLAVIRELVK